MVELGQKRPWANVNVMLVPPEPGRDPAVEKLIPRNFPGQALIFLFCVGLKAFIARTNKMFSQYPVFGARGK